MKIGILADSHDNVPRVRDAVDQEAIFALFVLRVNPVTAPIMNTLCHIMPASIVMWNQPV